MQIGLPGVLQAMRRYARGPEYQKAADFWAPAPLLRVRVSETVIPAAARETK